MPFYFVLILTLTDEQWQQFDALAKSIAKSNRQITVLIQDTEITTTAPLNNTGLGSSYYTVVGCEINFECKGHKLDALIKITGNANISNNSSYGDCIPLVKTAIK